MAGTSLLDVWDAIETLSDRGKPIAYPRQSTRSLSFPTAIITLTTLAVAAVPLVLLNPERVDGLPMLLSLFLFPMMAGGLIIELVVLCELQRQEPHWNLLWWPLVALPTGLLIMSIGPVLAYPDYFDVTSSTSAVGVMMMFTLLILLGLGLSFLFWPFVVLPLRILGLAAVDARRGERIAAFRIYTPFILLAVPTISLVAVASLDDMEANRAAAGQVVLALLGIPGEYETAWEPGLWIVRGITLALIGSAAWARASSSARNKQNTGKTGA